MADQITDGRVLLSDANSVASYVGSTSPALDNEIYIYDGGATGGSIGEQVYSSKRWVMYDDGASRDWSGNIFYIWINCGIVGLLDTKANGGLAIRFAGPSTADFFEVYVAGSDDWPNAIQGGWSMFVVDVDDARAVAVTNSWTGGTTPVTTALQHVGYSAVTGGAKPRNADNTWMDAIWRLPNATAGLKVEGRNAGTTDWTWDDIVAESELNAWGMAKYTTGGAIALNTGVQFFVDDASTHAFTDTNQVILFEDHEYAPTDLYLLQQLGAATGTSNLTIGIKTGTGSAATGAQGCSFISATAGIRWSWDSDAANIDSTNLYGCTFQHGDDFQLDAASNEIISCQFLGCSSAIVSNSTFQRNSIVDANTLDDVAFITVDDLADIENCIFQFSDGHAIEVTAIAGSPFTFTGNSFIGYGTTTSTDAAIYNNSAGAIVINVGGEGATTPTYKDGTSASTTVNNNKTITVDFSPVTVAEVRIYNNSTGLEEAGIEDTAGSTFAFSVSSGLSVDIVVVKLGYEYFRVNATSFTSDQTFLAKLRVDNNFENP